jgi:TatA/E family protein of Tat protein translocase
MRMPFNIGPLELIIVLVIALLILGPGKLPEVGSALGKTIREFRKASQDIQDSVSTTSPAPAPPAQQPPAVAAYAPPPAPPPYPAAVAPTPTAVVAETTSEAASPQAVVDATTPSVAAPPAGTPPDPVDDRG